MQVEGREQGIALHHRVSTLIKDGIATGRYRAGDQLPTEQALVEAYGVSRVTVRRALQSLEQQGLIERFVGRGTFVRQQAAAMSITTPIGEYLDKVAQRRALSRFQVKEFGWEGASAEVAASLQVAEHSPVLRVVRLRTMGRLPLVHGTLWLPESVAAGWKREDFRRNVLSELLGRTGLRYGRIEMVTRARLAVPSVAEDLNVPVGSALVDVQRIGYDEDGRAIEYQLLLGPPDRYETHVTIRGGEAAS